MDGRGKTTGFYPAIRCEKGVCRRGFQELIGEEPLLIRIEGRPYSVVMRTPGEEVFHAAGFCLGEGIVDAPHDFASIGHCPDLDANVVEVRLKPERRDNVRELLDRRGFVSQTSCGICGKEMLKDIHQIVAPAENGLRLEAGRILACIRQLSENQQYYRRTRGSHAAMLFDRQLEMTAFAEDVGRHSALDKAVGKAFLNGKLPEAALLILSSRMSYEMVQKAARARLAIIISMSRPTALAAEMGQALNLTLACADKNSELIFVCGENRIVF